MLLRTAAAEEQEEEEADEVSEWSEEKENSGYFSDGNHGHSGADVSH
jgi:hypothetical protein